MSGFVDFIVALPKDAKSLAKKNALNARWPATSAKFVFEYHLRDLWQLLAGSEQDDGFPELALEGLWRVYSLPESFVKLLASVQDKDVSELAKRWYADWDSPALQDEASLGELISDLVSLAKKAKAAGKAILVRESQG